MSKKSFWSRYAHLYHLFVKRDAKAYNKIIKSIYPVVKNKSVLELATGNGVISKNIVNSAKFIEATDYSKEMIGEAKKNNNSTKIHFSVQNIFDLPYSNKSFQVIIASNVLHIIPNPEKAVQEMKRVLTDDGVLILPTFVHGKLNFKAKLKLKIMKIGGFPLHSKWNEKDYSDFLLLNGLKIIKKYTIQTTFPLVYTECIKVF